MQNPNKSNSNPLTSYDIERIFQMPDGIGFSTLEELASFNSCTVEQIADLADLADPVACVEAALKLYAKNTGITEDTITNLQLRRHILNMLTYVLCNCEDALLIDEMSYSKQTVKDIQEDDPDFQVAYVLNDNGRFELDTPFLIATSQILDLKLTNNNQLYWLDIQSLAVDLDDELNHATFALNLGSELPSDSQWLADWQQCKDDMWRIDKLMKEPVK